MSFDKKGPAWRLGLVPFPNSCELVRGGPGGRFRAAHPPGQCTIKFYVIPTNALRGLSTPSSSFWSAATNPTSTTCRSDRLEIADDTHESSDLLCHQGQFFNIPEDLGVDRRQGRSVAALCADRYPEPIAHTLTYISLFLWI